VGLRVLLISVSVAAVLFIGACATLPGIGAGALLHPAKNRNRLATPAACRDEIFTGAGVMLRGWRCATTARRRGTIVWLHGVADNHGSAAGLVDRFVPRGFDLVAYDSRAHGDSGGEVCTYGFYEKDDLARVVDTIEPGPIVLIGDSLGGAVALQEAAQDPRITAVVAAETFSDLRSVATERAPRVFTPGVIRRAFQRAAKEGHFDIDAVSPVRAAAGIHVPVLLIHGDADVDTRPDHSRRIFAALTGPKRLILVPGGTHNSSLRPDVWREIDQWIDGVVSTPRPATPSARAG
jgi:alpha-beta hydrolase superfamily lysophospholipase